MKIRFNRENEVETDNLCLDDLVLLQRKVYETIDRLKFQLEMARVEKETYSAWYPRANSALSHKKREAQYLQDLVAEKRKEQRQGERSLANFILDVIKEKEIFTLEEYRNIVAEAERRKNEKIE